MHVRKWIIIVGAMAGWYGAFAQQSSDYMIVDAPIGTITPDSVIWVKWAGASRNPLMPTYLAPDSGFLYYDRSPGGGNLAKYRNRVNHAFVDTAPDGRLRVHDNVFFQPGATQPVPVRGTAFRPSAQTDMGAGVFYCVIALPLANDTLRSAEFRILVESPAVVQRIAPFGTITDLTPTFQWKANPGVPYYHVILSDEPIKFNDSSGTIDLQGLSIVWQAITPDNQIVYGAPDPSRTITADPPPLSPGQHYTWIVLNNYGNHPAFSSVRSAQLPPGEFTLAGVALKRPVNVYPTSGTLNSETNKKISFKWTNIDTAANTYKIYVYISSDFSGVLEGVSAQMTVWQTEVRAAKVDTMSVSIDAGSILTTNKYVWRVLAIDSRGAGTYGDTTSFHYESKTGTMCIYTREQIPIMNLGHLDTVISPVGLVQAGVEVLDGSMEAPLLFYTDLSGNLVRQRPTGTYRVTTVKDGFESATKTIALGDGDTTRDTFYLVRPESKVFGRVVDESAKSINLATVTGVSDRNDTVTAATDALGNYNLNCYGADWQISFSMVGYKTTLPKKITVAPGESYDFGTVALQKNPFTLSGVVNNGTGNPLLGVTVRILKDGTQIGYVPSTPQTGVFSFSVPGGSYMLTADKVGFTSYSSTVEVVNSKSITIVMQPKATMVAGFVYGRNYVGGRDVLAPITTATLLFSKIGSSDTFKTSADPVYGNYSISLPGHSRFVVRSSAGGYAPRTVLDTVATADLPNLTYNDTLQAYAMVAGSVRLSGTAAALGSVSLSLFNIISRAVGGTASSQSNGYFELRGILDGRYTVSAGKDGLVLDSIQGPDTITVSGGKPNVSTLNIYMRPGDKTIVMNVRGAARSGSVKIQSPIVRTMGFGDSIVKAGAGTYILALDAAEDSVVDCSYHSFTVGALEMRHADTALLDVIHHAQDTLRLVNGKATLAVRAADSLDSGTVFFRDVGASAWQTLTMRGRSLSIGFAIVPRNDGTTMQYYFNLFRGQDVYGYDRETHYVYIAPDRGVLSKLEIVPYAADTQMFPSSSTIKFSLRGYYSSSFIRETALDSSAINWSLVNAQGCALDHPRGQNVSVSTPSSRLGSPATVTVTIDTAKIHLKAGLSRVLSVPFTVSGTGLESITVLRTDAKSPQPISTSLADWAEFAAQGVDKNGSKLTCSPAWSIIPAEAGTISADGTFKPNASFIGFVRVFATLGNVRGEYVSGQPNSTGTLQAGLNVRHLLASKATADTAANGRGCTVVFPQRSVQGTDLGVLELAIPNLDNLMRRGGNNLRMVDSVAYDIEELSNVTWNLGNASINLTLSIPQEFQSQAASGKRRFWVASWNQDSLRWEPLAASVVSPEGMTVRAPIFHFSRYAVVSQPGDLSTSFSIKPNPFSPNVRPEGAGKPFGTCIRVKPEMQGVSAQELQVRIYNLVGDLVWSVQILNVLPEEYAIWWDGTTTTRTVILDNHTTSDVTVAGSKMCRNGRYFAVVIVKDYQNKEKRYMKPLVLMK